MKESIPQTTYPHIEVVPTQATWDEEVNIRLFNFVPYGPAGASVQKPAVTKISL